MPLTRPLQALATISLIATLAFSPVVFAAPPAMDERTYLELPSACKSALSTAHDQISAQREAFDLRQAMAVLQTAVGAACSLDLANGTAGVPVDALVFFAKGLSGDPHQKFEQPPMPQPAGDGGSPPSGGGPPSPPSPELIDAAKVVPCSLGGNGGGTLEAQVLGVPIGDRAAKGTWEPIDGSVLQVTGTSALVTGSQTGAAGVLEGIIPTTGSSAGTCLETTTSTTASHHCWYLVIYWTCAEEIITRVKLEACGAAADQSLLGLVTAHHKYKSGDAPSGCPA